MKKCIGCGQMVVDPEHPPQYDVMNDDVDLDHPETHGPYCEECWPSTVTAQLSTDGDTL